MYALHSRRGAVLALLGLGVLSSLSPLWAEGDLAAGFSVPPNSAKPRVYWYWNSGNISEEGISADLEAMHRVGIGGTLNMTIDTIESKGPVKFMSPQWRQLVQHAIKESARLGLEYGLANCEGWTTSGGPWITPERSMQQLVWSEVTVQGGKTLPLRVRRPSALRDHYKDIALFAFPAMPGDVERVPDRIRTSAGADTVVATIPDRASWTEIPAPTPEKAQWVEFSYDQPVTATTFRVETDPKIRNYPAPPWEFQISDDGQNFRRVAVFGPRTGTTGYTTTFPEITGRRFRLLMPAGSMRVPNYYVWTKSFRILKLALTGPRLDRAEARAAGVSDRAANEFSGKSFPSSNVISAGKVVDLTGRTDWDAPPGAWTLVRMGHTTTGSMSNPVPPESTGLECDKMSREAVEFHFNSMLAKIIAESGAAAGKTLKYTEVDSWEVGAANWTPAMRDEFKTRRGYDLWPWLPVLTGRVIGSVEASERFLWDFRRTIADLVADHHYGTLAELAHRHGIGLMAEAVGTKMPTIADQLQSKGRTDIPMGEFWIGKVPSEDTKEAASAAHIYGKTIAAAEAFTSQLPFAHWSNDPYSMKAMGDLHLTRGINQMVFNGSASQPWRNVPRQPGITWGRWGLNFERTNTWWEQGAGWMSYLARCQYLLQQGRFVADLCYLCRDGAPSGLELEPLVPAPPSGFDYDAINVEVLLTRMRVADGRIVLPDGMQYRVLVLPATDRMTLPALHKIRELVRAGATVVGQRPQFSPSLAGYPESDRTLREVADEVWGDCDGKAVTEHRLGAGRVCWGRPLGEVLAVPPDFECANRDWLYIHRRHEDTDIYFVSNQQAREMVINCTFRVAGKVPELWHPDSGRRERVATYARLRDRTSLPIHLDPVGSVFVIFRQSDSPADPVVAVTESRLVDGTGGPLREPLPLVKPARVEDGKVTLTVWGPGRYDFTTASGAKLSAEAGDLPPPIAIAGPWRVAFPPKHGAPSGVSFPRLISWTESPNLGVRYFSGTATYTATVNIPAGYLSNRRRLFLDLGTVKNLAEVAVNRKPLGVLWKEPFRIDITDAVQAGGNALEIRITNLLPNRMIGDQQLPENERVTWASFNPFDPKSAPKVDMLPLPSGLLGPVLIRPAENVTAVARPSSRGEDQNR